MKKFLISMLLLVIILFFLMWFSWGLKGTLTFFGSVLFVVVLASIMTKWSEFVDKHIKD